MTDYPTYAALVHAALVASGTGVHAADALLKLHRARVEVYHFKGTNPEDAAFGIRQQHQPELTPLVESVSMVTEE